MIDFLKYSCLLCVIAEQGAIGGDSSWCGPDWVGRLVACTVQENGSSLLHCQGEITIRNGNDIIVWLCSLRRIIYVFCLLIPFVDGLLCLQIVNQKTAACLCLTTVKNEDKMEFSKILEAIKVRDMLVHFHLLLLFSFCVMKSFNDYHNWMLGQLQRQVWRVQEEVGRWNYGIEISGQD